MRPSRIAPLIAVLLASCGGAGTPRSRPAASLGDYAATTNALCSELAVAVRRTFHDAPG